MPINNASQLMHSMERDLLKKYPNATVVKQGTKLTITETNEETEYNTESAAQWVDPHVKLNPKTNRYKQVKGYYRDVKKPVSIIGGGSRLSESSGSQIVAAAIGNENKKYERD
tara:strand:+ start:158 stop:496 length:339 start_codon:yes stop_codon:yes gene_type:complete